MSHRESIIHNQHHRNMRIEQIRRMPQETPEETEEKRTAARDFRIAEKLAHAYFLYCIQRGVIKGNPPQTGLNLNPEPCDEKELHFLDVLHTSMETTIQVLQDICRANHFEFGKKPLSTWTTEEKRMIGQYIFKSLTGREKTKGDVQLMNTLLAVGIVVSESEDYVKIYPDPEDADDADIGSYEAEGFATGTPMIIVRLFRRKYASTLRHEELHAFNSILMNSLADHSLFSSVWGGKRRVERTFITQPKELEVFLRDQAIGGILDLAKDEIIATYNTKYNLEDFPEMLIRYDSYDYLYSIREILTRKFLLYLPEDTAETVCSDFWAEYLSHLEDPINTVFEIFFMYERLNLARRFTFGYVLAQVPLEKWPTHLRHDFYEEVMAYDAALNTSLLLQNQIHSLMNNSFDGSVIPALQALLERFSEETQKVQTRTQADMLTPLSGATEELQNLEVVYSLRLQKVIDL